MAVLQLSEYNEYYFDGKNHSLSHNAGYTEYSKWSRKDFNFFPNDPYATTGEFFKDMAKVAVLKFPSIVGKKILEIGCAKGYLVEGLREFGVDAYGIDVSQYAVNNSPEAVKSYLTVADAKTYLSNYKRNEFSVVYSRWFIDCVDDSDMPNLVDEMNRISKQQVHIVMPFPNPLYYNVKTSEEWTNAFDWQTGTVIGKRDNLIQQYTK